MGGEETAAAAPRELCGLDCCCCIVSCMFLHIPVFYLSIASRVETSKILKKPASAKRLSDSFVRVSGSAEVFEDELLAELLRLVVRRPLLGVPVLLQGLGPLQGPGVQSGLQGDVVEDAARQQDGRAPLRGVLQDPERSREHI